LLEFCDERGPGEEELLAEYLKAVDLLTINEESRLKIKVEELTEIQFNRKVDYSSNHTSVN
jgi:hypothetical protein